MGRHHAATNRFVKEPEMIRSMFRGKTWLLALAVGCAAATTTSAGPIPARTGEEDLGRLVAGPGQTADESRARLLREANALQQHMIFLRQHILALEKSARELAFWRPMQSAKIG